jgi:hypothetical protein
VSRPTLADLRRDILWMLDDEWQTTTQVQRAVGVGGNLWYRVALVLERLANDGQAELRASGNRRSFRLLRDREPERGPRSLQVMKSGRAPLERPRPDTGGKSHA